MFKYTFIPVKGWRNFLIFMVQ